MRLSQRSPETYKNGTRAHIQVHCKELGRKSRRGELPGGSGRPGGRGSGRSSAEHPGSGTRPGLRGALGGQRASRGREPLLRKAAERAGHLRGRSPQDPGERGRGSRLPLPPHTRTRVRRTRDGSTRRVRRRRPRGRRTQAPPPRPGPAPAPPRPSCAVFSSVLP